MTQIDLGLLALNVIYLGVGYAVLVACGVARGRAGDLRLMGLAYLAGWALTGTSLSLLLMASVPVVPGTVVVTAVVIVAACAAVRVRLRLGALPALPLRAHSLQAAVATVCGGAVMAVAAAAAYITALKSEWTPEFDVLTVWLPRGEIVQYSHRLDPAQWQTFIDPWYPPLVPVAFGTSFQFMGGFHPSVLPIQQVILGVSFVLAVLALLDRYVPRWVSFPSLALLMVTPFFWWRLQSLMPDATLAYLLTAGAIVTVIWVSDPRSGWLVLGIVFLAAATLAKLEGFVFSSLLVVVMVVAAFVLHGAKARAGLVLLLGPAVTIPWHVWLDVHGVTGTNPDFNEPSLVSPHFLAGRAGGFVHAVRLILDAPWGPAFRATEAFILVAAVVLVLVVRRIPVIAIAALVWFGAMILALAATYATSRVALDPYFAASGSRVGGMFVVVLAALAPLLLGLALRRPGEVADPPPSNRDT